jgi:hypothetical protein
MHHINVRVKIHSRNKNHGPNLTRKVVYKGSGGGTRGAVFEGEEDTKKTLQVPCVADSEAGNIGLERRLTIDG